MAPRVVINSREIPGFPTPLPNTELLLLPHAWYVDQAILNGGDRLVVIHFGNIYDLDCKRQYEILQYAEDKLKDSGWAYFYCVDNRPKIAGERDWSVPDFNEMYELYDKSTVMFFYHNKHMMCDFGTGNNNKINWILNDKQDMIDIVQTIYKGGSLGAGQVTAPKDFSTRHAY